MEESKERIKRGLDLGLRLVAASILLSWGCFQVLPFIARETASAAPPSLAETAKAATRTKSSRARV